MPTIYSYVVAHDTGAAPNVDGGICTLALCKPAIRRNAQPGQWIVGLWPAPHQQRITFAMRVGEVLAFADYWNDPKCAVKRPGKSRTPDNIYRPTRGALVWVSNPIHGSECADKDLRGHNVLIADSFWYFGDKEVELPTSFAKDLDLPYPRRGHRRTTWSDRKLQSFTTWLQSQGKGKLGSPRDYERWEATCKRRC